MHGQKDQCAAGDAVRAILFARLGLPMNFVVFFAFGGTIF
jgi:hypothetical protein